MTPERDASILAGLCLAEDLAPVAGGIEEWQAGKAARIAEETIRTAEVCQAIVASGATGGDLAAALVEVAVRGEGRVKAIMAEALPEVARAPAYIGAIRADAFRGPLRWSCQVTFRKTE